MNEYKWIYLKHDSTNNVAEFMCPACAKVIYYFRPMSYKCKYEYCPHCGERILDTTIDITNEEHDCTTCRHGWVDERLGIPFCHNNSNCLTWELWEPIK